MKTHFSTLLVCTLFLAVTVGAHAENREGGGDQCKRDFYCEAICIDVTSGRHFKNSQRFYTVKPTRQEGMEALERACNNWGRQDLRQIVDVDSVFPEECWANSFGERWFKMTPECTTKIKYPSARTACFFN